MRQAGMTQNLGKTSALPSKVAVASQARLSYMAINVCVKTTEFNFWPLLLMQLKEYSSPP